MRGAKGEEGAKGEDSEERPTCQLSKSVSGALSTAPHATRVRLALSLALRSCLVISVVSKGFFQTFLLCPRDRVGAHPTEILIPDFPLVVENYLSGAW